MSEVLYGLKVLQTIALLCQITGSNVPMTKTSIEKIENYQWRCQVFMVDCVNDWGRNDLAIETCNEWRPRYAISE